VRLRKVPNDTILYYWDTDTCEMFAIPTFGYCYVLIDFGRSCLQVGESLFCSSEFYGKGKLNGKVCDNLSFDFARLCLGLVDSLSKISSLDERNEVELFMKRCLVNDQNLDLIKESNERKDVLFDIIDTIPRLICFNCTPTLLLQQPEIQRFKLSSLPTNNITPFLV